MASSGAEKSAATRFRLLTTGYWRGGTARTAWFWTLGLACLLLLKLAVDVAVNQWNRWFFDALERRDAATVGWSIVIFAAIILCLAAVGAGIVRARETLQVRWRAWLTGRLLDRWIDRERYFHMTRSEKGVANPEYRISDDARLATEPLVDFGIGMFTALLSASTFVGILWSVGGSLTWNAGWGEAHIPAYMVLGAIAYGVTTSTLAPLVGRRLPRATAARNESEALFRAETITLRENAEIIALTGAGGFARDRLDGTYKALLANWMGMVRQHVNVTWVTNASTAMIPVVPLLMATPKYLTGELSLGQVIQLASAFTQVQYAIGWLAENYRNVAEWSASARRIVELIDSLDALDAGADGDQSHFTVAPSTDGALRLRLPRTTETVAPGEHVLVVGPGADRSRLARATAGFPQSGAGALELPQGRAAFVASAPFLPNGPLAAAILCPHPAHSRRPADIAAALDLVGAGHLTVRLADYARWMQILSPSEKQRCAIARTILHAPGLIVIEDALSACDSAEQAEMTKVLFKACPQSIIVDFSNRPCPPALYDHVITLAPDENGVSSPAQTLAELSSVQT